MPLRNVTRGEGNTSHRQFGIPNHWYISPTPPSGEELKFSNECAVLLDKWFVASTQQPTETRTTALNEFIAFELSLVPQVESIFTAFRDSVFYVWVVVDRFEEDIRQHIYDREKAIIDEFQSFDFDFYIVAKIGRDPWDLLSEDINLAYQRGA